MNTLLIPEDYLRTSRDVYQLFTRVYETEIEPVVRELFPITFHNRGIHQTLSIGKNHYHGGVVSLLGDLVGLDRSLVVRIAAIAEFSWATLIVLDDLGDREEVRRGERALWLKQGELYASQSAMAALVAIIDRVAELATESRIFADALPAYLKTIHRVCYGQIMREQLGLQSHPITFARVMMAIASHLAFAGNLTTANNPRFQRSIQRVWRLTRIAACLKNDIEDLLPPAAEYKQGGTDIYNGQITYPIKFLYERLDTDTQQELGHMLAMAKQNAEVTNRAMQLLRKDPAHVEELLKGLSQLAQMSRCAFQESVGILDPERRHLRHVRWLDHWLLSYKTLGNPNLGE